MVYDGAHNEKLKKLFLLYENSCKNNTESENDLYSIVKKLCNKLINELIKEKNELKIGDSLIINTQNAEFVKLLIEKIDNAHIYDKLVEATDILGAQMLLANYDIFSLLQSFNAIYRTGNINVYEFLVCDFDKRDVNNQVPCEKYLLVYTSIHGIINDTETDATLITIELARIHDNTVNYFNADLFYDYELVRNSKEKRRTRKLLFRKIIHSSNQKTLTKIIKQLESKYNVEMLEQSSLIFSYVADLIKNSNIKKVSYNDTDQLYYRYIYRITIPACRQAGRRMIK
jgi:hypothetical protein